MNHLFTILRQGWLPFFFRQQRAAPSLATKPSTSALLAVAPDPFSGRDLMFTLLRDHVLMQHQVAEQQDTKATGIVIGGTTMVGFAFLVQHRPLGYCSSLLPTMLLWVHHLPIVVKVGLPYCPFLACYVGSIVFALLASRIHSYWTFPNPVKALASMNKPEQDIKLELSAAIGHFAMHNEKVLDAKAVWLRWAVRLLLAETLTLVLLLMYQTIC